MVLRPSGPLLPWSSAPCSSSPLPGPLVFWSLLPWSSGRLVLWSSGPLLLWFPAGPVSKTSVKMTKASCAGAWGHAFNPPLSMDPRNHKQWYSQCFCIGGPSSPVKWRNFGVVWLYRATWVALIGFRYSLRKRFIQWWQGWFDLGGAFLVTSVQLPFHALSPLSRAKPPLC